MLLERDSELEIACGALRSAHRGDGALLVVSGPLGCGKSELLRALPVLVADESTTVLSATGSALERDYAFGVVRQLLETTLHEAGEEQRRRWLSGAAGLAGMIFADDRFDFDSGAVAVRQAVLLGLQALVERLSADRTLLVLVDETQCADDPSLQWLAHLANRVNRLRALIVVAVQEGDAASARASVRAVTKAAARTLRPRPLSLAGVRAFVAERCGEPGAEELVVACHTTTDGNPLFLKSILLALNIQGVRPLADSVDTVRAMRPAQLRDRMIGCLMAQPEPVREFARAMAILSDQTDLELIGRLAGLDGVGCAEAIRVLSQLGLLTGRQQPRFSHAVAQEAAEESMTVAERERWHVRAVELLHGSGYTAEQVAAQLLGITSPPGQWPTEVLRAAASTALRRGAPETAGRYLRRALLDAEPDGEVRARLLVDLATVERQFDVRASVRHLMHALPLLRSPRDRADAMVRLAPAMLGEIPPAMRTVIRQVWDELGDVAELSGAERELKLRMEARMRHLDLADPAELADALRRLEGFGSRPPVDTPAERELLTTLLFAAAVTIGKPASEVARTAEEILAREPASPAHVHTMTPLLVAVLVAAESTDRLVPWLEMCEDHADRQGAVIERALIRIERASVALYAGRVTEARQAAWDALELGALDWSAASAAVIQPMAQTAMVAGDAELARAMLANVDTRLSNPCLTSVVPVLLGTMAMAEGDLRAALEHLREYGRQTARSDHRNPMLSPWRSVAADLCRRLGDLDGARDLAEEDCRRAAAWGATSALGRARRILAEVTDGDAGIRLLRDSVDVLEGSVDKAELARSLLRLGTRLRDRGDAQAGVHLRRCQQIAQEHGAPELAELAEQARGAAGPGHARDGCPPLTKAELRVARLAAEGHTNNDIGQFLGITRRAVEKHLTSSYRKLGIRRRIELIGLLPSAGGR